MTFNELVEEVYLLTGRRDLVNETKSAIKAATMKAHKTDFYSKDLYETGVEFPESDFKQSMDLYTFIPNFRAIKYLRLADDINDNSGPFIDIITPDELLDSYGRNRTNVAYVAGRVIEIRANTNFQHSLLGAYVLPIVTEANFSSWVASIQPFAIVYEAARVIFKTIGYDEQSATYTGLVAEEYSILRQVGLTDIGY